jgi:hypothetical protein
MSLPVTAVLSSWQRPENVKRTLNELHTGGVVRHAFVWNNNSEVTLDHHFATIVNANNDCGSYSRFAGACLSPTDAVLILDDDLILTPSCITALYQFWLQDTFVLHGIFGRAPKADGSDARIVDSLECEVPVVLTRAAMVRRSYFAEFFRVAPIFKDIQRDSQPEGNGEDIILSYTVQSISGRLNRIHRLPFIELPSEHGIHKRFGRAHWEHRTKLMRACEGWLKGH